MGLESATLISQLVATNPAGGDNESQGDDHLRMIKAVLQTSFPGTTLPFYLGAAFATVASAASTDIGAATSQFVSITGAVTITGLGTVGAGVWRVCKLTGAPLLTHNATSLILPGAANIQGAAGDAFFAISLGSGNWAVPFYQKASGLSVVAATVSVAAATDYLEGSWTPALNFGGSTTGITYTTQVGRYIKVGSLVTVWATFILSDNGSAAGACTITGLPYAASTVTNMVYAGSVSSVFNIDGSGVGMACSIASANSYIDLYVAEGDAGDDYLTARQSTEVFFQNVSGIAVAATYRTG